MSRYASHLAPENAPQTEPIPGRESEMAPNNAGGFTFTLDHWDQLTRFLVLGAEGGSYYASERKMTLDNAKALRKCLDEDGLRAVKQIAEISTSGRAPKNDPAIFALAVAASHKDNVTRKAALEAMPHVCRIGTHLFQFVDAIKSMRGWGRGLREGVARWYTDKTPDKIAYQMLKYRQRGGVSHHDVLHLCHANMAKVSPVHDHMAKIAKWEAHGEDVPRHALPMDGDAQRLLHGYVEAKDAQTPKETASLIQKYGLTREMVKTEHLNKPEVQAALLEGSPLTAMIRNLGGMTASGLLRPMSPESRLVKDKLADVDALKKQRVHPMSILFALKTYSAGCGFRGKLTWNPVSGIVDALNDAFYTSFGAVKPSGARTLIGLDVSGSMVAKIANSHLSAREASVAMALVTARVEPDHYILGFTSGSGRGMWGGGPSVMADLGISGKSTLGSAVRKVSGLPFGGTDCSLPMLHAMEQRIEVDTFIVLTDSETYAGRMQPSEALKRYRQKMGIDARLVVVGMTSTGFTIADPRDAGMLDVVGMDTATPGIISDFSQGNL